MLKIRVSFADDDEYIKFIADVSKHYSILQQSVAYENRYKNEKSVYKRAYLEVERLHK